MSKSLLFSIFLLIAFILFFFSISNVLKKIKKGKPEDRSEKKLRRLLNVIYFSIFQSRLFRFKFSGVLHFFIFVGFLILLIGVIENFLEGFINNFSFNFLGKFYSLITFIQDIFGLLVLLSALILLFRRFIFSPKRFYNNPRSKIDACLILLMIILVIITMYGANLQKVTMNISSGRRPVTMYISSFFITNGWNNYYELFWWAHSIIILIFLNYLPYSKHFHIISSIPNVFFSNFRIRNNYYTPEPLDFYNENVNYYGAKDVDDLSWKQLVDSYSCTQCGRCTINCPAFLTGKELDPRGIITKVKQRLIEIKTSGEKNSKHFIGDYITKEELWECTTCLACMEECPILIEHLISILNFKRYLVLTESDFPSELTLIFKNLENYYSPWVIKPEDRNNWIYEFSNEIDTENNNMIKLFETNGKENCDILFWVGCIGAIEPRNINVTKTFAKILNFSGVKFGVLGQEEKCNGDLARKLGNEYLAQELINNNVETFKKYNIKKIVTLCPHCYNVFKNEYSQFGIELEVYHHTQYIYNLLKTKKINITQNKNINITYHDPCYLGRYNNIYKEPRFILKSIYNLKELKRRKSRSFCCGAGGGKMFMEETKGKRIGSERVEEILKKNIEYIASSCPFCLTMLIDTAKSKQRDIQIKDISEIIFENIKIN